MDIVKLIIDNKEFLILLIGFITLIIKFSRNYDNILDEVQYAKMLSMKAIIMNNDIPLRERVIVGEEYVKLGYNGDIKAQHELNVDRYKRELEEKR